MTRRGVKTQLDEWVNALINGSYRELKPLAVVGLGFLPGNGLAKWLMETPIREEIAQFRVTYNKKFKYVLEYAEELAENDSGDEANFEEYRDKLLEWDYFYQNYDGPREHEFAGELNDWAKKISEDLAPSVGHSSDDFWEAAEDEFTEDELMGKFAHALSLSDILREYSDDVDLRTPRHPFTLFLSFRYTDEAIRSLSEAEDELFQEMQDKADEVYS